MPGLFLSPRLVLAPRLSHDQKLLLSQALALRLELRAPSFPNPLRGMPGILAADSFLKKIGAVGLLNGGLAEAVWNRRRTEAELENHKDVDVFVLTKLDERINDFEEGIDWWVPLDVHFDSIETRYGTTENVNKRFWINGNGCALCYRITCQIDLAPGLYFPSPELAVEIRVSECLARISDSMTVIDEDEETFFDKFRKKLGVRTQLPSFISAALGRDPVPYMGRQRLYTPFRVEAVPLEEQRALNLERSQKEIEKTVKEHSPITGEKNAFHGREKK